MSSSPGWVRVGPRGDGDGLLADYPLLAPSACRVAAMLVDQPALGHGQQPAEGTLWHVLPRAVGLDERLLHGVLATVELPVPADERAQDARRLRAQHLLDCLVAVHTAAPPLISGQSSIPPPSGPSAG